MPFSRALLVAVLLEALTVTALVVNWRGLLPDPEPEPEPMKVDFVKLPEPPPPPPQPEAPKPKPKPKEPPKPPEPPKPEDKLALPEPKPQEPEPPPPPPPQQPPPDLPPPDRDAPKVKKVPAVYPKDALSQRLEGQVRVRLTVSTSGKVLKTEVIESTPPGVFDYSATKATKQYVFPPVEAEFEIDQVIVYRIEDDRYGPEAQRKPEGD